MNLKLNLLYLRLSLNRLLLKLCRLTLRAVSSKYAVLALLTSIMLLHQPEDGYGRTATAPSISTELSGFQNDTTLNVINKNMKITLRNFSKSNTVQEIVFFCSTTRTLKYKLL